MAAPEQAFAIDRRMNRFVKTEVERARHVRRVKGLKR